jgi:hypothetical protein
MSLVDDVRRQISERVRELKPLVDEYYQLEAMLKRLPDSRGKASTPRRATRGAGTSGRRRGGGRPRASGSRSAQALALVQARPGITIPELADEIGITPNYLYRVVAGLAKDGKVKKQGKGWVPA